ncbi:MAG TPA: GldG family protein [Gammaproteobacteria bacterium]|nr:GldG family protein [Gammaproteobacteria bacterium]
MRITRSTRWLLRAQSLAFVVLLLVLAGLAAWISNTWTFGVDLSYGRRNSLSTSSRALLAKLDQPVTITAFVRPGSQLAGLEHQLLARYRRADPQVRLRFVNPDTALAELRLLDITTVGELYVEYGGRGEKLDDVSEAGVTNALLRLARGGAERIVFVSGHGEADPQGDRNDDLGRFGAALERQGFRVSTQNLAQNPRIAPGTALVVVAGPASAFLPAEVQSLERWIARGGSFLWLSNPGPLYGLAAISRILGVKPLAGTIVDTNATAAGAPDPTALVISAYGNSAITRDFSLNTLLPDATGFEPTGRGGWHADIFIASPRLPASWLDRGDESDGEYLYHPGKDVPGPVPIAIALSRPAAAGTGSQRAAVIGDVDFLANSFLGNGGNLNLGLRLFNWLSGEDRYLDVVSLPAPDRRLRLSTVEKGGISLGYLVALPLAFLCLALLVWLRRRRRR